jgi:NIMA (never in mitosis gene a)-related kinase
MNEEKIWNIFLQITLALNHCHWPNERTSEQNGRLSSRLSGTGDNGSNGRYQVLHRDLKPENGTYSRRKAGHFAVAVPAHS